MFPNRLVVLVGMVAGVVAAATTSTFAQAGMSEFGIRRVATTTPMPSYPAASVANGSSGVSVAAIVSGPDGSVTSVTILEAPDDAIAEAVRQALLAWRIPPRTIQGRSEAMGVRGKVTFYFRISGGRGRVFNPEDMPGGPKPEPASGPPAGGPGVRPSAGSHDIAPDAEIGEAAFTAMAASKPILLDIRERADFARQHRPGAINIPGEELSIRGYIELAPARPVVIDCTYVETRLCHNAAARLRPIPNLGKVFVLLP